MKRGAVNAVDIPTRVFDVKDFNRSFQGPVFSFQIKFKFEGFDTTERLELVEDVVNIEANAKNSGKRKGKSSLTSCVITQVVNATSIEHFDFSDVKKQTLSKNSSGNTLNNIIEITKYSLLSKVIVITGYVLRLINNLKLPRKKGGLCKEDIFQVNEYNESLKLWIKCEQGLLKRQDNYSKLNVSLKLFTDEKSIIISLKGRFANS